MYLQVMEEYEKANPSMEMDPMYDLQYYDQQQQMQQQHYGQYDDQLDDDMDGFDSDENLNGLYVEGLADRIWDDGDE